MGQFGGAWAGRVIQGPALSGAPWMSGIEQLAEMITTDLEQRLPGQRKTQRDKLALLGATMLQVRSANLMDVAACLPRPPSGWTAATSGSSDFWPTRTWSATP